MQRNGLTALAAATMLLAACGGGGGDEVANNNPPPGDTVAMTVTGTAAKGLISNGRVSAHAVRSDGSIDSAELASGSTDASGNYSLDFRSPVGQPVVIEVQARSGGATKHLDEISGEEEALPERFQLRGAILPTDGTSVKMTLTPFSEMAVAAAAKASNGLTVASIASGNATVRGLLGFDPTKEQVPSNLATATANQRKLKVMLASVSQLANRPVPGCTGSTHGEKVTCVVEQLSRAATPGTVDLKTDDHPNLGEDVAGAVREVLNDDRFKDVPDTVLTTVLGNLECKSDDDCKVTLPPAPTGNAVADAIAATKAMLQQVRSDFTALFVSGTTANIGDAQTQAETFATRMGQVQVPAEVMLRDTTALMTGIDLWNDFKSGRSTSNSRSKWKGDYATAGTPPLNNQLGGIGCTVFSDTGNQTPATSPANALQVGCSARYFVDFTTAQGGVTSTTGPTEYVHGFTIQPTSTSTTQATTFTWRTAVFKRLRSNPIGPQQFLPQGSTPPSLTGTMTVTLDATSGDLTSFSASGKLPAAFVQGGNTLVNEHHEAYTANLTRSTVSGTTTTSVTGSLASKDASDVTRGTLTVNSGSLTEVGSLATEVKVTSASLDVSWAVPDAEFRGVLSIGDRVTSADGAQTIPSRVSVTGTFTNIDGTTRTDFASGTFAASVTGFGSFNASQPTSSTNTFTANASFIGSVTAPGRPLLRLTLGTTANSSDSSPSTVTLQYRSIVSGTPRTTIDINASRSATGVPTVSIAEASTGVSVSATRGAATADVLVNGTTKIGVLDLKTGVLTFTDGTFVSAELKP